MHLISHFPIKTPLEETKHMVAMRLPILVILTGLPCTGKTYIGKQLAAQSGILFIHKDGIKECLFSALGWSDRAWSRKLGGASYDLMFYLAGQQLAARGSLIMEANFYPELHTKRFQELIQEYPCRIIQLQLTAEPEVLYERFKSRWESGIRHPGHVDEQTFEEIHTILENNPQSPMDLPGIYRKVDTTDFWKVDIQELADWFDHVIKEEQS